jgi:hypothetical protein
VIACKVIAPQAIARVSEVAKDPDPALAGAVEHRFIVPPRNAID